MAGTPAAIVLALWSKEEYMKGTAKRAGIVLTIFVILATLAVVGKGKTGEESERQRAIEAAERYLSDWAHNSYMYANNDLEVGTILDADLKENELEKVLSELAKRENENQPFYSITNGQENNIRETIAELQENMQFSKVCTLIWTCRFQILFNQRFDLIIYKVVFNNMSFLFRVICGLLLRWCNT